MSNNLLVGLAVGALIIIGAIALALSGGKEETATPAAVGTLTGTVVSTSTPPTPVAPAATSTSSTGTAPTAVTRNATNIGATTVVLHGTVQPRNTATTYWFEYSSDPNLGAVLLRTTPRVALDTRVGQVAVETDVPGLLPTTTYYYRIVANNNAGTSRGERLSFTTTR